MDIKEVCVAKHRKEKKDLQGLVVLGHTASVYKSWRLILVAIIAIICAL